MPKYFGDFNGDGKMDFITPHANCSSCSLWHIYYSNPKPSGGDFFSIVDRNIVEYEPFYDAPTHWEQYYKSYFVMDTNHDGKSDLVMINQRLFQVQWAYPTHNNTQFTAYSFVNNIGNDSNGNGFTLDYQSIMNEIQDDNEIGIPIVSNFNNHGLNSQILLAKINNNSASTSFFFNKDVSKDVLLKKVITSGGNIVDEISYRNMTINGYGSLLNFYTTSASENYPNLEIIQLPTNQIVSQLKSSVDGVIKFQDFKYAGFSINMYGLGAYGFKKFARSDWYQDNTISKLWTITESDISWRGAQKLVYTAKKTGNTFYLASPNFAWGINISDVVNCTENEFNVNTTNGVYALMLNKQTQYDNLTNVKTEKSYQYSTDGYYLPAVVTDKNIFGGNITSVSTTTTLFDNAITGTGFNYHIGRPYNITTTIDAYGDVQTTNQVLSYSGANIAQIDKKGNTTDNKYIREQYTHDDYGNVTSKTISAIGYPNELTIPPRTTSTTYDPTGRFVKTVTDVELLTVTNDEFDPIYGLVTKSTNPYGKSSFTSYDHWGKVAFTTDIFGKQTQYEYEKIDAQYVTRQKNESNSKSITYSDALARVIKTGIKNIDESWSFKDIGYNQKGQKLKESEPYTTGSPTLWKRYYYDEYGRNIQTIAPSGLTTTVIYDGLTVKVNDGTKTTVTVSDANGHVIKSEDPGGMIRYRYYANGNLRSSDYDGSRIDMEYNEWGVKTLLHDPAAGDYTYSYYATGETRTETTPKGVTTTYLNDVGKLEQKTIIGDLTDSSTTFGYDPITKLLVNTDFHDNIESTITSYQYKYDDFKRLYKTTEITPFATFVKELTFDAFGRVNTETSTATAYGKSSSKTIQNQYKNGFAWKIIDTGTTATLWETNTVNERGQTTGATLGSTLLGTPISIINHYDDYGNVTQFRYEKLGGGNIMTLNTVFDAKRENLLSRDNSLFGTSERFDYDSQDRLTSWENTGEIIVNCPFNNHDHDYFATIGTGSTISNNSEALSVILSNLDSGIERQVQINTPIGEKLKIKADFGSYMHNTNANIYIIERDPATGDTSETLVDTLANGAFETYYTTTTFSEIYFQVRLEDSPTSLISSPAASFIGETSFTDDPTYARFTLDNFIVQTIVTKTQEYDNRSRITVNNIGEYHYDNTDKVYQNTGVSLTPELLDYYDQHDPLNVDYNVFKSPVTIDLFNVDKIDFLYNVGNSRSNMFYGGLQTNKMERISRKHYSLDGSMEVKYNTDTQEVEFITFIGGNGYTAPIIYKSDGIGTNNFLYLHRDYQGTILAITDQNAHVLEKRLFDPWGEIVKVQDGSGHDLAGLTLLDRGYTGHEHLQSIGLIHMNGRLYDPKLHRFLQPDNYVQNPYSTQSYNRYGYCMNNPLRYTDPSGEFIPVVGAIIIGAIIGAGSYVVGCLITGTPIAPGGLIGATFMGAFSGAVTFGIGEVATGIAQFGTRFTFQALAHGTFQGGLTAIQGGNFWNSFAAGAVSSLAGSIWGGGELENGKIWGGLNGGGGEAGMIAFATIAGGVGAELTGGNFWQGAVTGLIVSGLNHAMHKIQQRQDLKEYLESKDIDPGGKTEFSEQGVNNFSNKAFPEMMSEAENPVLGTVESFPNGDEGRNTGWTYDQNSCKVVGRGRIFIARSAFANNLRLASTIGHELIHAIDLVNGNMNSWLLRGTEEFARYKSEDRAYSWERNMMSPYYDSFNHSIATFKLSKYGGL